MQKLRFLKLFVCLHARSVRRHTWVVMGPDLNKMLKPGFKSLYKYACLVVYENNRYNEQIKVKGKGKERLRPLATNQVEQFYCQPLGQKKGKTYPISTATKAYNTDRSCNTNHWRLLFCAPSLIGSSNDRLIVIFLCFVQLTWNHLVILVIMLLLPMECRMLRWRVITVVHGTYKIP